MLAPLIVDDVLQKMTENNVPSWCKKKITRVGWVNWRKESVQIQFVYNDACDFAIYVDFKAKTFQESANNRDSVLEELFKRFAPAGAKPYVCGWGYERHSFIAEGFVSVMRAVELAEALGFPYTVIYTTNGSRERMAQIGLPIVAGETGKEWIDGFCHSYKPEFGKNL